jgi:hypothetical protein
LLLSLEPAGTSAQGASTPSSGATPEQWTEQAKAALRQMSGALTTAHTVRFKVHSFVPMKTASGDWITLIGSAEVVREGKNYLKVDSGGDLYPFSLYFDGHTLTAFSANSNVYAQEDSPGTIDAMLDKAAKRGETTFVFADLVSADPYAAMTKGLQSAKVVGSSTIDGVETEHLVVHGAAVDWEIWIGTKDRLPRMVTLTNINDARKPTHTVQLSGWVLDEAVPAGAFVFQAPADAVRVPFRAPGQARAAARRGPPSPTHQESP